MSLSKKGFLLVASFLVVFLLLFSPSEVLAQCEGGFTYNPGNGHCYRNIGKWGWPAGRDECVNNYGAYLVTINDQAENNWLVSTFGGGGDLWTGYNDIASEGNFVWVGQPGSGYENWNAGEPNDGGDGPGGFSEDCAAILVGEGGVWNDAVCSGGAGASKWVICEKFCDPWTSCHRGFQECGQPDVCGGTCSKAMCDDIYAYCAGMTYQCGQKGACSGVPGETCTEPLSCPNSDCNLYESCSDFMYHGVELHCGQERENICTRDYWGSETCSQAQYTYCPTDHCDDYDPYGNGSSISTDPCGVTLAQCGQSYDPICAGQPGCSPAPADVNCADERAGDLTRIDYPNRSVNHCDPGVPQTFWNFPNGWGLCRNDRIRSQCDDLGGRVGQMTNQVFVNTSESIKISGKAYRDYTKTPPAGIEKVEAVLGTTYVLANVVGIDDSVGGNDGAFAVVIAGADLEAGDNTITIWAKPNTTGFDPAAAGACTEFKIAGVQIKRLPNISGTVWKTGIAGPYWSPCGGSYAEGLGNVQMELEGASGTSNCDMTTTTAADGTYSFVGLWPRAANTYSVKMVRPADWEITCPLTTDDDGGVIKAYYLIYLDWDDLEYDPEPAKSDPVDFGIWNILDPWFVTEGGDLHANSSITSPVPETCRVENRCFWDHYEIKGLGPQGNVPDRLSMDSRFELNKPGMVSCQGSVDYGDAPGGLSSQGWLNESTGFDVARIEYGYDYFKRLFAYLPDCTAPGEEDCIQAWDGSGSVFVAHDGEDPGETTVDSRVYKADSNVTISWFNKADFPPLIDVETNWVITGGKRIVLLVDGDVRIKKGIRFSEGGMLAVIASGNILFHKEIVSGRWVDKGTDWGWVDTGQRVGGVFVADGTIASCAADDWEILGTGACRPWENDATDPTPGPFANGELIYPQILFGGSFTAWGGFALGRSLEYDGGHAPDEQYRPDMNNVAPAEIFVQIPEFVACLPAYMKRSVHYWQERVPRP